MGSEKDDFSFFFHLPTLHSSIRRPDQSNPDPDPVLQLDLVPYLYGSILTSNYSRSARNSANLAYYTQLYKKT